MHENMEVVFLGTGASWPSVDRNVPAIALKRGAEIILFDCGEGTQRQFQRSGLSFMQVSSICITHLHGDHYLGLPGIVQTMGMNDRRETLHIYGPPGIRTLCEDFRIIKRTGRGARASADPRATRRRGAYRIEVHEIEDGHIEKRDGYQIRVRRVDHRDIYALAFAIVEDERPGRFNKPHAIELGVPEGKAFGALQRGQAVTLEDGSTVTPDMVLGAARKGRHFVYTGDCTPSESVVELARGADVLVHECTYGSDFPDANKNGHSTAAQAGFIAKSADVRKLLLTHISPRYNDAGPLEEEARKAFSEAKVVADLDHHVVKFPPDPVE